MLLKFKRFLILLIHKKNVLDITLHSFIKKIPGFPFFIKKDFKFRSLSSNAISHYFPYNYDLKEIINGRLTTSAGVILHLESAQSFWKQLASSNHLTYEEINCFYWLSFFNQIGIQSCRNIARDIIKIWIRENNDSISAAWSPRITAIRLINWAHNYHFLLSAAEDKIKDSIHYSFRKQLSFLASEVRYIHKVEDLVPAMYAVIRLSPKRYCSSVIAEYAKRLEQLHTTPVEEFDQLPSSRLVELLQYFINIRLLLENWKVPLSANFRKIEKNLASLIKNATHLNGRLVTFGDSGNYPNEFINELIKTNFRTSNNIGNKSKTVKITSAPASLLINMREFIVSNKEMFSPIGFEYSCDQQMLVTGAGVCIENESFHGRGNGEKGKKDTLMPNDVGKVSYECYEENSNYWCDSSTKWTYLGEKFTLTRKLYLCRAGQELRCEDWVSHAYGFKTFLMFSISSDLRITQLKEVNGFILETDNNYKNNNDNSKPAKWAWYFSKDMKYNIVSSGGANLKSDSSLINSQGQSTKYIIIPCSLDYDHTISRWSLRRL